MKNDIDYKKLYDTLYNNGYHGGFGATHSRELISKIPTYLNKKARILDIGCSNGTCVSALHKMGYESHGVDISEISIKLCKQNNVSNCKAASATELDYPDKYFNGIISTDVLEHIDRADIYKVFDNMMKVTTNKAFFFLQIATRAETNREWDYITKAFGIKNLHVLIRNSGFWYNLFNEHDLNMIECKESKERILCILYKKNDNSIHTSKIR